MFAPAFRSVEADWRLETLTKFDQRVQVLVISTYIIMVFFATVTQADSDAWAAARGPGRQQRGLWQWNIVMFFCTAIGI